MAIIKNVARGEYRFIFLPGPLIVNRVSINTVSPYRAWSGDR